MGTVEPSTSEPEHEPPPDSPTSRQVRKLDDALGLGERVLLALIFLALVSVGFYRTVVDIAFKERPLWAIELIKVGVFAIAMLGAAYATHLKRNFSLDLVSRFLSPRNRAVLRVLLNLATAFAAGLLYYGGQLGREGLRKGHETHEVIPVWVIAWFVPLAAVLIMIHVVLHTIIEVDYLARGKVAPEPEQAVG